VKKCWEKARAREGNHFSEVNGMVSSSVHPASHLGGRGDSIEDSPYPFPRSLEEKENVGEQKGRSDRRIDAK
jgi:hypothetical protein